MVGCLVFHHDFSSVLPGSWINVIAPSISLPLKILAINGYYVLGATYNVFCGLVCMDYIIYSLVQDVKSAFGLTLPQTTDKPRPARALIARTLELFDEGRNQSFNPSTTELVSCTMRD